MNNITVLGQHIGTLYQSINNLSARLAKIETQLDTSNFPAPVDNVSALIAKSTEELSERLAKIETQLDTSNFPPLPTLDPTILPAADDIELVPKKKKTVSKKVTIVEDA
jgi:hypothetical protein